MCFYKTKESKVLIAKRDIKVYKIGVFANNTSFTPFFMDNFKYLANKPTHETVAFLDFAITQGLHSYINCLLNPTSLNLIDLYTSGHLLFTITLSRYAIFLGKFIIPKGALYCLNCNGEVVSDTLIYTSKYIKLKPCKRYNTRELWKEK